MQDKNKLKLILTLSLVCFQNIIIYAQISLHDYSPKKDLEPVVKILKESPQYLILPEYQGGLAHTKTYFTHKFMTTTVAKKQGKVVGFINYTQEPVKYCHFFYTYNHETPPPLCNNYKKLHYIHLIAVSKNHTREGIASKLLEHAKKYLKAKPILVDIHKPNHKSQGFFKAKNFKLLDLKKFGLEADADSESLYMIYKAK